MSVKITILYDNRCDNCDLQEGWGFSSFIEFHGNKILFDTGGDVSAFSSNFEKMQLSYSDITHLLFSHRHWDHKAGFQEILKKLDSGVSCYVPKTFFWPFGKQPAPIKVVSHFEEIAPNTYSLVLKGGFWLWEQALVLKTEKGLGIITGCAHPGILQILRSAQKYLPSKIHFVLGGFHLLNTPPDQSAQIVREFQSLNVEKVAPCHCSGDHLIRQFQQAFGSHFSKVGTGTILHF